MKKNIKQALLVIDAQKIYTDSNSELYCRSSAKTVKNINRLINQFTTQGLPIFLIRHVHAANGSDLGRMFDFAGDFEDFNFKAGSSEVEYSPDLNSPKGAIELTKTRYSSFQKTKLDNLLKKHHVGRVVVCGFMTNFCCESTAREAHDRDYYVTFIPDATGCPDLPSLKQERIRDVVSKLLEAGFATIVDTDTFLEG
jgi:nicotinamidase-related amidase